MQKSRDINNREVRTYETNESANQAFEALNQNGASPTLTEDHGDGVITVEFDRDHYEDEKSRR